ncbi:hypothetical protein H4W19_12665 [Pseudoxanthomonas mexicana]|jgi:protocatechuate 3,4-dioxygenase beta subunit|uniref:Intradiol ring-cleavage dioxygenases domain-containing protein n=1 Tax=Pseudoxanthomonas mexicana TaxID=128785 RepID=A0ABX6R9M9_PSEMX|nr:hypothetical protein H4W19_12665 [Pseudoxanthomonas mexicana]
MPRLAYPSFLPAFRFNRAVALWLFLGSAPAVAATPIVGLPCEDCEVPLIGLPAHPPATAQLAPEGEPGQALRLTGRVLDAAGHPRGGVIVYAHQTDQGGIYPGERSNRDPGIRRHGRLRAWATSDAEGRYTFLTVRPGSYPGTTMPQHIHLYVIEPGCALYYIDDVLFRDDPHLTPAAARRADQGRGGSGIVTPRHIGSGWVAQRDIMLGRKIPGYPSCRP